ncbi:DUF3046 domain-containing protein [Agromyces sp. MMS24-JH15]|uniref:DUF3046 domain-containing protein n=1 Tax=Agromyces sp. MMS24-JH15 TaxID=3243765 RepID=UPI003748E0DB
MKLSEFRIALAGEFGAAYGEVVLGDVALEAFGGRTAREALDAGVAPQEVWLALCAAMDVPPARRHGAHRREPKDAAGR